MRALIGEVIVGHDAVRCIGLHISPDDDPTSVFLAKSAIDAAGTLEGPRLPDTGEKGVLVRELWDKLTENDLAYITRRLKKYTGGAVLRAKPVTLDSLVENIGADAIRGITIDKALANSRLAS